MNGAARYPCFSPSFIGCKAFHRHHIDSRAVCARNVSQTASKLLQLNKRTGPKTLSRQIPWISIRRTVCVVKGLANNSDQVLEAFPGLRIPSEDAEVHDSGLTSIVLKSGLIGGQRPGSRDVVTVHYTGWRLEDGEQFDTTLGDEPCTFETSSITEGWTQALKLLTVGEQRRFWIPSHLAYGEAPAGGQPAGALVFDIELVSFERVAQQLQPKMGGIARSKNAAARTSREFKSPWRFLDNLIP